MCDFVMVIIIEYKEDNREYILVFVLYFVNFGGMYFMKDSNESDMGEVIKLLMLFKINFVLIQDIIDIFFVLDDFVVYV